MSEFALELQQISVTFHSPDNPGQRYNAVADTTLRIRAGEFVAVVGPTGCGKSTLLNIGAGLLEASSGDVKVFGEPLVGINRRAGYMFQTEALMPWRSAIDNVMVGLQYRGMPDDEARSQAQAWLERVGLAEFGDRYPHQLSGGMRKRTALAQVLALDPDIILMDEPFSALDIQTRQLMENEVLDLWAAPQESRSLHHPRPGRSHCDERPGRGPVGGAGDTADRRVRHRPAAPARRGRGPDAAPFRRVAHADLGGAARRGAQGLRPATEEGGMSRRAAPKAKTAAHRAEVSP